MIQLTPPPNLLLIKEEGYDDSLSFLRRGWRGNMGMVLFDKQIVLFFGHSSVVDRSLIS